MDLKRLAVVLCQRLAPIYIAVALSWVTGYFVFTIGIGLAIALELAWPLLRPLCDVLYEELMAQHSQAQAQRRTALLKTFLPFFQAYKTVLTTYPPAMLTASAKSRRRSRRSLRPYATSKPAETQSLTIRSHPHARRLMRSSDSISDPRDFRDCLQDCQTWRQDLLAMLAKGRIAALRHAVQHVLHERPRQVWDACLAEAARDLEAEAEHTLRRWPCLQRAHADLQCASVWRLCSALTRSIARRASNPT